MTVFLVLSCNLKLETVFTPYSSLGTIIQVYFRLTRQTILQPHLAPRSLKMVNANRPKELQNVLPKCNPFARLIEYHRNTDYVFSPLCHEMAISRVSLRTLLM